MSVTPDLDERQIRGHLSAEGNLALTKGGLYSALLGFLGGAIPLAVMLAGQASNLEAPVIFAFCAGAYSLLIWALARRGLMRGALLYVVFLPFVSLPTLFFVLSHLLMPAGSATYITGPISYLYFHLIIMTGFLFRPGLSIAAGAVCGAGYLACFLLGRAHLASISSADPTLTQDLVGVPIYAIKSFMMLFGGLVVAALGVIAKRLILRVLAEERQKTVISRLFGQYVSDEVKEKIIAERAETIGERKLVVVLFSDIRGFSTYSEDRDPERVVSDLNEYFESMVEAITQEGGVIDKFIGDAIMAVFGGVLELEDPAAAAVRAALRMRRNLRELNARWSVTSDVEFDNGIGMHFGEVLQGTLGSVARKEFTVVGDTVNTAARLEGRTKDFPEAILITDALYEQLPEELKALCTPHGAISVKGRSREVSIYGVRDR